MSVTNIVRACGFTQIVGIGCIPSIPIRCFTTENYARNACLRANKSLCT